MKQNCLANEDLRRVLLGQLPKEQFDSAISHLDRCDACRMAVEQLENLAENRGAGIVSDPFQAESACQVALNRMMERPKSNLSFTTPLPCETLGPYRLLRTLGIGGMGTVYLAEHQRLKRQVAVKLLPRERVNQPGWLDRFEREMTTIAALEHPNVVRATDAGHQEGWHYLVMEYLDGMDVGRIAHRVGQLPIADACEIVRQAALGLAHVHELGLVHRDIKPSNLMLTRSGQIKLLDLGLVLAGDDPLTLDDRLTTVGHLMGTMGYMAPEQLMDSRDVDSRADLYSLGATLYRLIAGHPPHSRTRGVGSHVLAITSTPPKPLDAIREETPPEIVELVREMLSLERDQRPENASHVAERLRERSHPHSLKQVLREALRKPDGDDGPPASFVPSVVDQASQPPSKRFGKGLFGGWFGGIVAGSLLLAALVIKVQTDRGELVIHSEQDGLTVLIKQDDEVVETLSVQKKADTRTVLRKGTYRVEIEGGGDALVLSDDVVTIGRGTISEVAVQQALGTTQISPPSNSIDQGPIYQGKDHDAWRKVLTREQDAKSLGEAMVAIETLSRENSDRLEDAVATIETARRLGGMSSASSFQRSFEGEPSMEYMRSLLDVFPNYLPEPGLVAIDRELAGGNRKSRIACLWLLKDFFEGVQQETRYPEKSVAAADWIRQQGETAAGNEFLDGLAKHLREAVQSFDGESALDSAADEYGVEAGLALTILRNQSIVGDPWLETYMHQRIQPTWAAWREIHDSKGRRIAVMESNPYAIWQSRPLSDLELIAASQIAASDEDYQDWVVLASMLLSDQYNRFRNETDRSQRVFHLLTEKAPETLLRQIEIELEAMRVPVVDGSEQGTLQGGMGMGMGMGGMGGGGMPWIPVFALGKVDSVASGQEEGIWATALPYYAEKVEPTSETLDRLQQLRSVMEMHNIEQSTLSQNPYAIIDAAIETVKQRLP
ncbi:serine/threonine protein kinase [Novipirellula artificiosorum]|uniref:Serine/threonine-protein kinase PknB n=1 Tax=Novipirellula artificiosorum TaxID=2528016 RepID=A0A5C6E4P6_9BACT|nr:serine/threonine-protein kinase [Novipirellula artificiosorum]TWU42129.1 Serine/threonine-protein kinase PknB [Novipirellula artificiosorum]